MNHFDTVPHDVLQIILGFIDSLKDCFALLLVCKRFYDLIKTNDSKWKTLCLEFWKEYKQSLPRIKFTDYCKEGSYDLKMAQETSGKNW
jgi:hypothetical protein